MFLWWSPLIVEGGEKAKKLLQIWPCISFQVTYIFVEYQETIEPLTFVWQIQGINGMYDTHKLFIGSWKK